MEHHNIFETTPLSGQQEAQWISLSDLMTGLMMLFMLIAISFMLKIEADTANAKKMIAVYKNVRQELYQDLYSEFQKDLSKWGADLSKDTLSIRFKEPDVLFDTNKYDLKPKFREILEDFFPRYVKIITSEKYRDSIEEVRIEGHTSSVWNNLVSADEAYYKNMELSQARTRSTLQFAMELPSVVTDKDWLRHHLTANGLSSSKIILTNGGAEDAQSSQRVEFRIRTDAEAKMQLLLNQ
jgi:outer membrane protein OmpA-like peptidoglycan-associated protein